MPLTAKQWLEKIHALTLPHTVKIMNVCGGHERSITMAGLRTLLPSTIELIPGPGCPVCICPEEDVYAAIQLALHEEIVLVAFGDMLRVPVNVPKTEAHSLEQAKARGADIRPIASPLEVLQIAQSVYPKKVIFFAVGFETTTAPVAALLEQGIPDNLFILLSARLTWPAVAMLLNTGQAAFHALIAPGHVATIMGSEEWQFVVDVHKMPVAIAGFTPDSLLAAIYSTLRQLIEENPFLDNCYPQVVTTSGNITAKQYLQKQLQVVTANWRGVGLIEQSGFQLINTDYDARLYFPDYNSQVNRPRAGQMPPGCACAQVVLGTIYPNQCPLYGTICKPRQPIGPCMVSDEGACRIWWASGIRNAISVTLNA